MTLFEIGDVDIGVLTVRRRKNARIVDVATSKTHDSKNHDPLLSLTASHIRT